jgi:hypothetical protein
MVIKTLMIEAVGQVWYSGHCQWEQDKLQQLSPDMIWVAFVYNWVNPIYYCYHEEQNTKSLLSPKKISILVTFLGLIPQLI